MKHSLLKPFTIWIHLASWKKIATGLILGVLAGLTLGEQADIFIPIGNLFINAIHMMVVPVVFTAIVCAVTSVTDTGTMRRMTIKAMFLYLFSMVIAAVIGLCVGSLLNPGLGFHPLPLSEHLNKVNMPTFSNFVERLIPKSPVTALAEENILQIVVFSLFIGISIKLAGEPAKPIADFFQSLLSVVFKLASIVIGFAPYGIFALIAWTFGHYGLPVIKPLIIFISAVYLGCFLQLILVYAGLLFFGARLNPFAFFKGIMPAMIFAYTTSSSAATLPLSMKCAENNLGVGHSVARFLLPLGSSFNLNGLSIYLSVATIFAANMYGIHLGLSQFITIITTVTLTAMGVAAVPGSALIIMGAVMGAVGIPLGAIALIAGVDRINDMAQTLTNVSGDIFATVMIAKSEDNLDQTVGEWIDRS